MKHQTIHVALWLIGCAFLLTGCGWGDLAPNPVELRADQVYANAIAESSILLCGSPNEHCDVNLVLDAPDGNFVSLGGSGGSLVVKLTKAFTNGAGPDLRVYEMFGAQGGEDEPFDVLISSDGSTWIPVAEKIRDDPNALYASIDIVPAAPSGDYWYVKIVDRSELTGTSSPGSDIDAVEALWTNSP